MDAVECVRCGTTAMLEGSLLEGSSGGDVRYCSNEISKMKRMFSIGIRTVKAYACLHCSHLELMVEFTEKDRKRVSGIRRPATRRPRPHRVTGNPALLSIK